jgi:hypothetical protein
MIFRLKLNKIMKNKFNNKLYKKKNSIRHQKVYKFIVKNAWNLKINKINY